MEKLVKMFLAFQIASLVGCLEQEPADPEPEDQLVLECGAAALHAAVHDGCDAMDALGDGACYCAIGFAWDGDACVTLTGCECRGADCDRLAETEEECLAAHEACSEPEPPSGTYACGSAALFANDHDRCDAMDVSGDGLCNCMIGFAWDGDECVGLGGCECLGADCGSLTQTIEECQTAHETCEEPATSGGDYSCGSAALFAADHDRCDAMDAAGDGACYCALGYAWDGSACVMLGGCECLGADCGSLEETEEDCVAAHETCRA